MLILPGPASLELAKHTAELTGLQTVVLESKIFPDGESYFRFRDKVRGEDVALIQSTCPPQDQNLVQLMLLLDGLKDMGCKGIYAIAPYLSYMRQDKRFLDGEVVSAQSILNLIKCLGIEKLVTVDIHNPESLTSLAGSGLDLTAMPLLANWIHSRGFGSPLIVAPDRGALQRAKTVSEAVGANYVSGMKTRDRQTGQVTVEFESDLKVAGCEVVIVDDLIARGDTIIKATEILLQRGAKSVTAVCTHGLFLDNALARMKDAGVREVISTDTIPSSRSEISVAPVIARALQSLTREKAQE